LADHSLSGATDVLAFHPNSGHLFTSAIGYDRKYSPARQIPALLVPGLMCSRWGAPYPAAFFSFARLLPSASPWQPY